MTNERIDDLLDTLRITKTEKRDVGGTWVDGTIGGHRFQALIFDAHAENPAYELADSRISKLWLQRLGDKKQVANFDRGWDVRPTTNEAETIVDLLCAGLADAIA